LRIQWLSLPTITTMSLITQCPACNTLFKVVADQLKISQGWVRCGQCKEVFDANAHLAHNIPAQAQVEPSSEPEAQLQSDASRGGDDLEVLNEVDAPVSASAAVEMGSDPSKVTATKRAFGSSPEFASSDWVNSVHPPSPEPPVEPSNSLEIDALGAELGYGQTARELQTDVSFTQIEPASTPTFVRQAQQAQRWRSPWVRAGLSMFAFLLFAAGIMQVVLHERDRIVAMHPRMHSTLIDLCRLAGCSIGPLKHIEAIVVDASSFNKIRGDSKNELYKITLNLKNNGPLPVALPHIELSLNDTQDQTIVRRVLNPADVGAVQFVLSARGEFNGSATVQIDTTQLGGSRVAGYRIWAFYPS
jgi:predicted Zn finger-like uncharacterized protein